MLFFLQKGMSYEDMKRELGKDNIPIQQVQQNGGVAGTDYSDVPKYSYEELSVDVENLPSGVDPAAREVSAVHIKLILNCRQLLVFTFFYGHILL